MTAAHIVWRFLKLVRNDPRWTYHPERHYMRGPGPACLRRMQNGGARITG